MRFAVLIPWFLLLCHCARGPARIAAPATIDTHFVKPPPVTASPAVPEIRLQSPRATRSTFSGIIFEGVAFDTRSHHLVVVDQANGPGSQFADARTACLSRNGLAAANAGFFTPEGSPLGLVVSGGKRSGAWNSMSSLGSGVWHDSPSEHSAISRREMLGRPLAPAMSELLQAGPMLVENGRAVPGLNPTKASVRTVLLWDGGTRWWLGRASACSLADLATTLSHTQPAGWPVRHALNLDGGRSSDLWISGNVNGGPVLRRAPWNRPVRNFLILIPR